MLKGGELCQVVVGDIESFHITQLKELRGDGAQVVVGYVNVYEEMSLAGKEGWGKSHERDIGPKQVVGGRDLNSGAGILHGKWLLIKVVQL